MEKVIDLKRKRTHKPVLLNGKTYIFINDFAERVGVAPNTIYQWVYEGRLNGISQKYLGRLVFEEKAIEPFKRTLMTPVSVSVYR